MIFCYGGIGRSMGEEDKIMQRIATLQEEHRSLDLLISGGGKMDQIHLMRLKKRKLRLKDEISRLHSVLEPDIIA